MTKQSFQPYLHQHEKPVDVIYVSSYIPRKCGIATYTKDLTNAINLLNSRSLAEVLVVDQPENGIDYPWEAKLKMTQADLSEYLAAAEYVNRSHCQLVSLQHEFGIYGGEWGEYIVHFAEAVQRPLVTTFHTVPEEPNDKQVAILRRLARASEAVVVMMHEVATRLRQQYGISARKIVVIPHGVPDLPFGGSGSYKKQRQLSDRLVLGNINLLSPNKGIEYALQATARIARRHPEVLYVVIGQTHPTLLRTEGEQYRLQLRKLVRELGIERNVRFVNEYLSLPDLTKWLRTLDFYITPYLDAGQVTSGALAYAIGAGKACVSTPYLYAREALAEGRGVLVPFRDARVLADAVMRLWANPVQKEAIEHQAYQHGRLMTWPNVANSHLHLFRAVLAHKPLPGQRMPAKGRIARAMMRSAAP
ncbi:MAG TPA: glycosyltransferase family 4 protein [Candidatus Andersenbacteria bacterium]|nr:glycosyltransferase family 4 protein [Candidatus Andersenbacteria bacterium]